MRIETFSTAEEMKSYWNYRVMAEEYESGVELRIHEVFYDGNDRPCSYTENSVSVHGESIEDLEYNLEKMKEALNKPILKYGDGEFPEAYQP